MSYSHIHHDWKEREAIRAAKQQAEANRQEQAWQDDQAQRDYDFERAAMDATPGLRECL